MGSRTHTDLVKLCKNYVSYPEYLKSSEEKSIYEYCTGTDKTSENMTRVKELMKKVFKDPGDRHVLDRPTFDPHKSRFCRAFVPPAKELECQSQRRHVIVLDFMGLTSTPLSQDYYFCDVSQKPVDEDIIKHEETIKYNITYLPIDYGTSTLDIFSLSTILNSSCNVLLIHIDPRINPDIESVANPTNIDTVLVKKFTTMVNTYLSGYEIPIVVYNFGIPAVFSPLDFPNVNQIRIRNVLKYNYKTPAMAGFEFIYFDFPDIIDNDLTMTTGSPRLSCQWWFRHFFKTIFECGKGRLQQFSGTCYMTAAFNTIILGEYTKRIMIDAMNNVIRTSYLNPEELEYVRYPIEEGVCVDINKVDQPRTRIKYYMKIFYNTICGARSVKMVKPKYEDIFKKLSMSEFRGHASSKHSKNQGGFSQCVLFRMFADFGIRFLVSDSDGNLFNPYTPDINKAFMYLRINKVSEALALLEKPLEPVETYDVILYLNEQYKAKPLPKFDNFEIETSTISFDIHRPDPKDPLKKIISGHTIMGFICDGYYKIYDSNNVIENCNWANLKELQDNSYTRLMARTNDWDIKETYNDCAIYVNYSKRLEYLSKGVCEI